MKTKLGIALVMGLMMLSNPIRGVVTAASVDAPPVQGTTKPGGASEPQITIAPTGDVKVQHVAKTATVLDIEVPVLTDHKELEKHVGHLVVIRGTVSNYKLPTIIGVDVEDNETRNKLATATGMLLKHVVSEKDVDQMNAIKIAHRGAGTFYRLIPVTDSKLVAPVVVPQK